MTPVMFHTIGTIHTPYERRGDAPRQGGLEPDVRGTAELFPEYARGLRDLDGLSHVILIFHFDRAKEGALEATPPGHTHSRGVFASRSPSRPNGIGLTVVRLLGVEGNRVLFGGPDMLDGTPLLDIKPFVPRFDSPVGARAPEL